MKEVFRISSLAQVLTVVAVLMVSVSAWADPAESQEARQTFEKAYDLVFGPQGATLHYDVNIVGLYKTSGTIWYKGRKQRFTDERVDTWNDGVTAYMAFRKKKVVEIHQAQSDKRDKYSGKFKFSLDDFTYAMEHSGPDLLFTLKQRRGAKGSIKEVRAVVDAQTLAPKSVRLKVAFFWCNIKISRFRPGGIRDEMFVFPRARYERDYRFVDKR